MVWPLITAVLGIAGSNKQKKAEDEAMQRRRQMIPAEIMARSAARKGAPMEEYRTMLAMQGMDQEQAALEQAQGQRQGAAVGNAAVSIANMFPQAQTGPSQVELEEYDELQRQRETGFRTRPMRRDDFF